MNFNGAEETIECIRSILVDESVGRDEVVIVDNGSTDDSVARMRRELPGISIVENKNNLGYAEGFNTVTRSLERDDVDLFFFLNNDIRIPRGTIGSLQQTLRSEVRAGVVGPAVLEMGSETVQSMGSMMDWPRASSFCRNAGLNYNSVQRTVEAVDYVSGCAMLVDAEALRRAGLFDARLFMYSEEVDLCLKIAGDGYRVLCDSRVSIEHKRESTSKRYPAIRNRFMTRNRVIIMKRYARVHHFVIGLSWMMLVETPVGLLRCVIMQEPLASVLIRCKAIIEGIAMSMSETRIVRAEMSRRSTGRR